MRRMRALILGATGLAGGAIRKRSREAGDEVIALVRHERAPFDDGSRIRVGSIGDPNAIAEAAEGVDVIFVAVGLPIGRAAEEYRWLHVAGVENVIRAARHVGVPRVVLISSADVVLADLPRIHWDEKRDLPHPPVSARARALKLGEEIALAASDRSLDVTALRPGWLWGPGDRARLSGLVAEARSGGIDLCGDGRNLVATTYVEHLADAARLAARSPRAPGQAYYVGDPEFLEIREFLGILSRTLSLPTPRATVPYRLRYIWTRLAGGRLPLEEVIRRGQATYFDTQKATAELGFEPRTSIDQGMAALARWYWSERGEGV